MPRSRNAEIAVKMYEALRVAHGWDAARAWHGMAWHRPPASFLRHMAEWLAAVPR